MTQTHTQRREDDLCQKDRRMKKKTWQKIRGEISSPKFKKKKKCCFQLEWCGLNSRGKKQDTPALSPPLYLGLSLSLSLSTLNCNVQKSVFLFVPWGQNRPLKIPKPRKKSTAPFLGWRGWGKGGLGGQCPETWHDIGITLAYASASSKQPASAKRRSGPWTVCSSDKSD